MSNKIITDGIVLDCTVFNESIGAEKDLILINYSDFDFESTANSNNRQVDNSLGNLRGLTDIFLKDGAVQHIFEGTDYSVVPTVTPETREDGNLWYTHSLSFTVYSKKSKDRQTLTSLSGSKLVAVTKDRSTGLYELFGMYQGLKLTGIDRTYIGTQNSNFYQVTIATPELSVIKEPSLSELSIYLDGGTILPPSPTPGIYGDATPTVQGLVRVDTLRTDPIVYTVESVDFKFEAKDNKVTTEALVESNKNSIIKYPSLKAIVDWIVSRYQTIITPGTIQQYYRGDKTWQTLDKNAIGLGNVDNTSDAEKPLSDIALFALELKADLIGGLVPSYQLPSYVDDVVEGYYSGGTFYQEPSLITPITGEVGKIYQDLTSGGAETPQYRWSGSMYIQITNGFIASSNDVPEGSNNLYWTAARGLANVLVNLVTTNKSIVTSTDSVEIAIGKLQAQNLLVEPILLVAPITGTNQTFNVDFHPGTVLKSRGELYKGSEWTYVGTTLTIIINLNSGNSIYVKP